MFHVKHIVNIDDLFHMKLGIMKLQVGVKVLIKNQRGELLLIKRNPEKYPEVDNPWDIPGGRIDIGTTLCDNLAREIREEIGADIDCERARLISAQDILRPDKHVVRLTYIVGVSHEIDIKFDCDEHVDHKWATPENIKAMSGIDQYVRESLGLMHISE